MTATTQPNRHIRRTTGTGWFSNILIGWLIAYAGYFAFLVSSDSLLGIQLINNEWLFGSHHKLATQLLEIMIDSSWIVLPVIAIAALTITLLTHRSPRIALLVIIAGSIILLAALLRLHFSWQQTLPFLFAFASTLFVVWLLAMRRAS